MLTNTTQKRLSFHGKGPQYFGIWAVNIILTILSLGLYYPWAKANMRRYLWNETELDGDRFVYHGTGKEAFKGFLIAYGVVFLLFTLSTFSEFALLLLMPLFIALVPFAIFSAWRYRASRTSWRGIFFSFTGNFGDFIKMYLLHGFFTVITFGIYGYWFQTKIMNYLFSHTKIGQYKFDFKGEGVDLFVLNILFGFFMFCITGGIVLLNFLPVSILGNSLGMGVIALSIIVSLIGLLLYSYVYFGWYVRKMFEFNTNNTVIHHSNGSHNLTSKLTSKDSYFVLATNTLMVIFSFGLAFPFAYMRSLNLFLGSVEIPHEVNLDYMVQDAKEFTDATGDEMVDALDSVFDIDMDLGI